MLNKVLVFGGLGLTAILVIENMVGTGQIYILWFNSSSYMLAIASTIIGFFIGLGVKSMLNNNNDGNNDDDLDF